MKCPYRLVNVLKSHIDKSFATRTCESRPVGRSDQLLENGSYA